MNSLFSAYFFRNETKQKGNIIETKTCICLASNKDYLSGDTQEAHLFH